MAANQTNHSSAEKSGPKREPGKTSTHSGGRLGDSSPIASYDSAAELCDQIARFPSAAEIEELCAALPSAALREFATELVKAGMVHVQAATNPTNQLEYATLLNSWITTAEETVAAGRNVRRIAARRKSKP